MIMGKVLTFMFVFQNGGTSCPACRALSTSVTPSRALQLVIDVLLRADPSRGRTDREKQQADEIYRPGQILRVRFILCYVWRFLK